MLANILGGFIAILVGVNLIPTIADQIYVIRNPNGTGGGVTSNVSGASGTILGLTVIFFALGIMSAGVALAITGLRNAGIV